MNSVCVLDVCVRVCVVAAQMVWLWTLLGIYADLSNCSFEAETILLCRRCCWPTEYRTSMPRIEKLQWADLGLERRCWAVKSGGAYNPANTISLAFSSRSFQKLSNEHQFSTSHRAFAFFLLHSTLFFLHFGMLLCSFSISLDASWCSVQCSGDLNKGWMWIRAGPAGSFRNHSTETIRKTPGSVSWALDAPKTLSRIIFD